MEIKQIAEHLNNVPVRKKAKRLLALTLAVLMMNPVTGYGVTAHAQEAQSITAFSELPENVAYQQLAVGAKESDIHLPDTLEATIVVPATDTAESTAEEPQPDGSTSEEPAADETPAADSAVSENSAEEQQDGAGGAEDTTAAGSSAAPVVNGGSVPALESTTGAAIDADTADAGQELSEATQTVTLENITWEIDAENSTSDTFDSSENGAYYTYAPVLPEGYTVADGVNLPEIGVRIGRAMMRMAVSGTTASIGTVSLEDGKYYNQAGEALDAAPTDGNPYLYYSGGVLTVTGAYVINTLNPKFGLPQISIGSGTLTIAGEGSLIIENNNAPCVTIQSGAGLVLAGAVNFKAQSNSSIPIMLGGSFRTADGYSGAIRLEGMGSVLSQMEEIDLNTTGAIEIYGRGSAPIVGCDGSIQMTGADIKIQNTNNSDPASSGILVSAGQDVSLTATTGGVNLEASSNYPVLDVGGNITLSAAKNASVMNYDYEKPGVNWKGSKFTITAAEAATVYGQMIGTGDQPNVEIKTTGGSENMQLLGGISLGSNGTCTVNSNGAIEIRGLDGTKPVFSGKALTLDANDDIIVRRENDDGSKISVIAAAEQQLTSKNGMVIVSGSTGSTVKTKDGQTIQAAFGGYVTSECLNLSTPPTVATFFIAGEGSILYTPAQGGTPAVLALTNATINTQDDAIILRKEAVMIQLNGKNTIRSEDESCIDGYDNSLTITSSSGGTLDMESGSYALSFEKIYGKTITIAGNASVTAVSTITPAVFAGGNLTVEPTAKFAAKGMGVDVMIDGTLHAPGFSGSVMVGNQTADPKTFDITIYGTCDMPLALASLPVGTSQFGVASLHILSGAQMTVPSDSMVVVTDMTKLKLEGKIINNGIIYLPVGTAADQIKAMKLTGSGAVLVPKSIDENGMPSKDGEVYSNNGVALKAANSLDLTANAHSGKTVANDGYSWDGSTLTLGGVFIEGDVMLPANATVNTTAATMIQGRIMAAGGSTMHLTFTGAASLAVNGGISAGSNGDTVTVQSGARVTVGGSLSLGEGGDGVLTVTGPGTVMEVSSSTAYAVYCQNVKVENGAALTVKAEGTDTTGVKAVKPGGNVSVTGGSTLTAGCDYGVFLIDGKLTVDDTSKLITNGAVAPFCILDTTSNKEQSKLLSLANIPSDTEIASVKGTTDFNGSQHTYWSLIPKNGKLGVEDEEPEFAALTDAKTGTLTFAKAATPNGNNDNEDGDDDNGGSGRSSGSSSTTTTTTPEKKPDQPVIGSVNASGKVSDHHAVIIITDSMVKAAIEKAQSAASAQGKTANGIGAEVSVTAPGAKSFTVITERAAWNRLVSTNVTLFRITSLPANFCFDRNALNQQQTQGSGNITMVLKPVTVKNIRNAYDITLSTVKDGKTVNITSMDKGSVTLSLPYTLGNNEAVGGLYAVSVDAKGNAIRIAGSAYDVNSKNVIFTTNHFSQYGIGYTAPAANFTDISSHWAKESIDYVVGRGLLSGTSETAFSPNSAMTRGMLVTALGRLAGVDTKAYTKNSFTDVKADSTYRPYTEWAYSKGIIQGIANSQFAPDREVTREEIAVIFANYAKATGYTLPITREATTYADASGIGSAYKDAVKAMQQAGIMMGGNNNVFRPTFGATRAEVAVMLTRYIKLTIDPATARGWALNDAGQHMYYKDGKALTGWQSIDGKVYCFDSNGGAFASGWKQNVKGEWLFLSPDGSAVTGWKDIGANGNNKTYYFTRDGLMVSGKWLEIDGKWYYFYADGSLARSMKIDGYEVDKNGVRKTK